MCYFLIGLSIFLVFSVPIWLLLIVMDTRKNEDRILAYLWKQKKTIIICWIIIIVGGYLNYIVKNFICDENDSIVTYLCKYKWWVFL